MLLQKAFGVVGILSVMALSAPAQKAHLSSVERISVVNDNPLQIQIQTSRPPAAQTQMVSNPDRLVIDIPDSVPGPGLHPLAINRADVGRVRFSRYSANPAVTRVVVDLNSPEWYRVEPNASGLVISLGGAEHASVGPEIGWVSGKASTVQIAPVSLKRAASRESITNEVRVEYANGQLAIHASDATLSEVLFQIQKITGAEIAIPAGTERERVAADFGPGTASEVLGELLNGTGLNFVVVGSPADPNRLRNVILTRKTGEADPPSAFESANEQQVFSAPVIEPDNNPDASGAPPENAQPQQQQPGQPIAPPPEVVPN